MNVLQPGSVAKIKKPFKKEDQLENVNSFLAAIKKYGVPEDKCFAPEDLNPGTNIPNVINCILALGRQVKSILLKLIQPFIIFCSVKCYEHNWEGPSLGPKPTGQKRDWPENILRASEAIVPSQYGSNKFASQSGVRFGAQRDIINNVKNMYEPPKKVEEAPVEAAA